MIKHKLTIFDNVFDNKTDKGLCLDWGEFKALLFELSDRDGYKPTRGDSRRGSPLVSPAFYDNGTTRANKNVIGWGAWAALDIDEFDGTLDEARNIFKPFEHVIYSSASSRESQPKFRVILPCSAEIPADKIKHFWYAINKKFADINDAQTKDLSRMYYVPARYPDEYHFIHENAGETLNPAACMAEHDYAPPAKSSFFSKMSEEMQQRLLEQRRMKLTNRTITWTSYLDCPFVKRKKLMEYSMLSGSGWYSMMYSMMVSIAGNAVYRSYPITGVELECLAREIDAANGSWYKHRPLRLEAERAIEHVLAGSIT